MAAMPALPDYVHGEPLLGAYNLDRVPNGTYAMLGSGAFGVVLRASGATGPVAIKLVFCTSERTAAGAQAEATNVAGVEHRNVVRMLGVGVYPTSEQVQLLVRDLQTSLQNLGDRPLPDFLTGRSRRPLHSICAIAMEYINGQELFDWFTEQRVGGLPPQEEQVRPVVQQLVTGVGYMHTVRLPLRDLKLENAMVAYDEGGPVVKIIDLGFVARVPEGNVHVQGPDALGSPSYLAPELRGAGGLDLFAADAFSVGVTLFTLTTGSAPWRQTSPDCQYFRTFMNICRDAQRGGGEGESVVKRHFLEIRRLTRVRGPPPRLTDDLWRLLDGLMCLDPRARLTMAQAAEHPWLTANEEALAAQRAASAEDEEVVFRGVDGDDDDAPPCLDLLELCRVAPRGASMWYEGPAAE